MKKDYPLEITLCNIIKTTLQHYQGGYYKKYSERMIGLKTKHYRFYGVEFANIDSFTLMKEINTKISNITTDYFAVFIDGIEQPIEGSFRTIKSFSSIILYCLQPILFLSRHS